MGKKKPPQSTNKYMPCNSKRKKVHLTFLNSQRAEVCFSMKRSSRMNENNFPAVVQACDFTLKVRMKLFLPMYLVDVVLKSALQKAVISFQSFLGNKNCDN